MVAPAAPLATTIVIPPGTVAEGTPVALTAVTSGGTTQTAPGILIYQWNISGPDGYSLFTRDPVLDFNPPRWGLFTVSLTTTDAAGDTALTSSSLSVQPVIQNATAPTFNGSNFTVPLMTFGPPAGSGDAFTYTWTVNGQVAATTQDYTLSGIAGNSYAVTLQVSDAGGPRQWPKARSRSRRRTRPRR